MEEGERQTQWQSVLDETLRDIAQVSAVRSLFQPLRDYAEDVIDKLSWTLGLLVGLQALLVLLMLAEFVLTLRSTILVQTF